MQIPQLIIDLAIMLSTAAVVTVVFKRLKLPVILGYILSGFLISPYFPLFLDVASEESIKILSEIGVVIILFHIGLEFDIKRIASIGSSAIITAIVKMSGVMAVGFLLGRVLGLETMDCVFLGAMLSISSTVVIQKCLIELNMEKEKFADIVMGSLVIEDVIGVLMMVVLSTISVSQSISGASLTTKFGIMACSLVVWMLLGIYFVPTIMNKIIEHMTDEMLTVLSLGFCFLMALLANKLGFSIELGAFIAGSLLAGTNHADDIERVTAGVKDLFGTVFFMSVGMMVDPKVIASSWMMILPIAIVAVVAKLIMATIGVIISGQDLDTAVKAGAALAPIGEFSFIIAAMGVTLGVIGENNYPLIVSASILTIIVTPYLIKGSGSIVGIFERVLPNKLLQAIDDYTSDNQSEVEKDEDWKYTIRSCFKKLFIYGMIMLADVLIGVKAVKPALLKIGIGDNASNIITLVLIYTVMAIFIKPMLDFHSISFTHLWLNKKSNRLPLAALLVFKLVVIVYLAYIPLYYFYHLKAVFPILIIVIVAIVLSKTAAVQTLYLQIETRFLRNLNERTIEEEKLRTGEHRWLYENTSILSFTAKDNASYVGKKLKDIDWGRKYGVYLVKLRRGKKNIINPSPDTIIKAGDKLYVFGDTPAMVAFHRANNLSEDEVIRTLEEFMDRDYPDSENELACTAFRLNGKEKFIGKSIKKSGIKERSQCIILGVQRDGFTTSMPDANMLLKKGDVLWVIGTHNNVGILAAGSVGEVGQHEHCHSREISNNKETI